MPTRPPRRRTATRRVPTLSPAARGLGRDHREAAAQALALLPEVCAICGQGPDPDDPWSADHVVPRARGGQNVPENYQRAHLSCNKRKGAKPGLSEC